MGAGEPLSPIEGAGDVLLKPSAAKAPARIKVYPGSNILGACSPREIHLDLH
ncbi:MAG: hypothetical protein ABGY71_05180 [bacterium]